MNSIEQEFYVIIERDQDGYYVGQVPQLRACYSQGRILDELMVNIKEVVEMCLEEEESVEMLPEFVGVQRVTL